MSQGEVPDSVSIRIDGRVVAAPALGTLREAAALAGVAIPTMCERQGFDHSVSCMVCVVKDRATGRLLPSCAARPVQGMEIETGSDEVLEARRGALELLLGNHVGDCEAPCRRGCPAEVDVPLLIRQVAAGELDEAVVTLKSRVALPGSLTHICSVPCERSCRRARHDGPLSICLLERVVADHDLRRGSPWLPPREPSSGRRVAIVGSGPAGMSAAYFTRLHGHDCTVFEQRDLPGGILRGGAFEGAAPAGVLDAEIEVIRVGLGVRIVTGCALGRDVSIAELTGDFDAVILAIGALAPAELPVFGAASGLAVTDHGVHAEPGSFATSRRGVFAAGRIVRPTRHAALAAARGKSAAHAVDRFLAGKAPRGERRRFSSAMGTLLEGEMAEFLQGASPDPPLRPGAGHAAGYTIDEAVREAGRCLHCDCHKKEACRLRELSDLLGAVQRRFHGPARGRFRRVQEHPVIIYEPEKCIRCGLCIQAAARAGEPLGLSFIGRGFEVRVGVPFGEGLVAALENAGPECATVCPTGALAVRAPNPARRQP